jgi:integrase
MRAVLVQEGEVKPVNLGAVGGVAYSNFIDSIRSPETQGVYKGSLNEFATWVRDNRAVEVNSADDLLKSGSKVAEGWINDYLMDQKKMGKKWSTLNGKRASLFLFFEQNEVDISSSFKRRLKKKMPEKTSYKGDRPYALFELQRMLQVAGIRMRFIILMLASTGMRRGGLAGLKFGDVERHDFPEGGHIYTFWVYRGTQDEYRAACTPECAIAFDQWQRYLEGQGVTITPQTPLIINERQDVVKPLTSNALGRVIYEFLIAKGFRRKLAKAEGQQVQGLRGEVFLTDGFRKFWDTEMIRHYVPHTQKEKLMGHKIGLDEWYARLTIQDLLKEYVKAIPALTITEQARGQLSLSKQVRELEQEQDVRIKELASRLTATQDAVADIAFILNGAGVVKDIRDPKEKEKVERTINYLTSIMSKISGGRQSRLEQISGEVVNIS